MFTFAFSLVITILLTLAGIIFRISKIVNNSYNNQSSNYAVK